MKAVVIFMVMAIALASCDKEKRMSDKNSMSASQPNKYPEVPEETLKGAVRTRFDSPQPTEAQLARRSKNNKLIREMGLPVLESLPVVEDAKAIQPRGADEVARRCLATTFCAIKGETKDQELVDSLIKDYAADAFFSAAERQFIHAHKPPDQDLVDFCWRYECVHVFLWALGQQKALVGPAQVCPVPDDMKAIRTAGPLHFVSTAKLRAMDEILDAADLYYRLHWAAIELRIKGKHSDRASEEIIRERHRALNWLIRYFNQDWDNVATDT